MKASGLVASLSRTTLCMRLSSPLLTRSVSSTIHCGLLGLAAMQLTFTSLRHRLESSLVAIKTPWKGCILADIQSTIYGPIREVWSQTCHTAI